VHGGPYGLDLQNQQSLGEMTMLAALYERVSTQDQSVDMQRFDLQRYCEQRGFEVYREYCDHGVSGSKDHRPALNELMADARKR